jgi:hypothetical protein
VAPGDFPFVSVGRSNLAIYPHAGQTITIYVYLPATTAVSGTVVYQFTNTEAITFVKLIAGKSLADAQALLLKQTGVAQATINISDNPTKALPGDPNKIAFVVFK